MNAIEFKNLTKRYPGFELENITFEVPEGCIVGLVGQNGAGKSTTIRLLLGLTRPDGGEISLLGERDRARWADLREEIGVVLDTVGLPASLKLGQIENVMKGIYRNWDEAMFRHCVELLRIPSDKKFHEMSNGTKMKVGLAVAFSHHPRLLVLDEATNGLDPVAREEINDMLLEFTREENHSVLISSHIVSDLEKICDYVAFLHEGRLLLCEEKDVLAQEYVVVQGEPAQIAALPAEKVLHREDGLYGSHAVVRREAAPAGMHMQPVGIEELFVMMSKEMKRR